MDYNTKTTRIFIAIIAIAIAVATGLVVGLWVLVEDIISGDTILQYTAWLVLSSAVLFIISKTLSSILMSPVKTLSDVIVYAGHSNRSNSIAPDVGKIHIGHELVASLARQVYDLASMSQQSEKISKKTDSSTAKEDNTSTNDTLDHIGIPIFGIDPSQNVTIINKHALEYIGKQSEDVVGKPFYDALFMSFQDNETFEKWLKNSQANTAVGTRTWQRVRIADENGNTLKQFDLVASFSNGSQTGTETMLAIYDRTAQYARDDGEVSFVSLAIHEIRTPLTAMRGYIEVFNDELGPTLNPEMKDFMYKMQASAQQLTAFVGNILNVARVEENQLTLKLEQYRWNEIIDYAVNDLQVRAIANKIKLEVKTEKNLPPVAVDRISINEVINNIVENAMKYSEGAEKIKITSKMNDEGMVEVSIEDFGVGIPEAVMPGLFQKFYRSHKSSVRVIGTGLGLYLCKALVNAHGGNIWVRSKEGEGSTFSFTIQPYDKAKHEKDGSQSGIMRGAHGWIKNHSLNRQ